MSYEKENVKLESPNLYERMGLNLLADWMNTPRYSKEQKYPTASILKTIAKNKYGYDSTMINKSSVKNLITDYLIGNNKPLLDSLGMGLQEEHLPNPYNKFELNSDQLAELITQVEIKYDLFTDEGESIRDSIISNKGLEFNNLRQSVWDLIGVK